MKLKYIGYPIKDGCHVTGADRGVEVINNNINIDKIIDIEKYDTDEEIVIKNDLKLAKCVDDYQKEGFIPITIGGDHSLAIGSVSASSTNNDNLGIIWFDTHPDINTKDTTVTYNIHGYPLAALMGFGQDELTHLYNNKTTINYENVVMFGINDIDEPEQELINKYNIKTFTLNYINEFGIDRCINEAIEYLNSKVKKVHLSFDIDSINYNDCPGVNVPNRWEKGLKKDDAMKAFKELNNNLNIVSMDIVEYNPLNDIDNKSLDIVLESINFLNNKYK